MGSTFAARRAGNSAAANATKHVSAVAIAKSTFRSELPSSVLAIHSKADRSTFLDRFIAKVDCISFSYPWETLHDEHKILAIDILARLIANASLPNHDQGNDHE